MSTTPNRRSFYMVGKPSNKQVTLPGSNKSEWRKVGIDFIDEFAFMSKKEQFTIKLMKDIIMDSWSDKLNGYNYIVEVKRTPYT